MKIMQILPVFGIGGAETMCETLSNSLKEKGNEVIVVSLYGEKTVITERMQANGLRVVFLDKQFGFDFGCVKKLKKMIREENPDIIHTHLYSLKYAILASLFSKRKIVHTLHSVASKEATKKDRKFNGIFFRRKKVIPVALSKENQKTVEEEYGIKTEKIPVVFNGVNLENCIIKQDYSKKDIFSIICVARFSLPKNHIRLIEAFSKFSLAVSDSKLVLVGDGEYRKEIEKKVRELKLEEKVIFAGLQSNVYPFLADADVFTLSSDYEGIPMTLIEAMGSGLPIVSTNVGGIPDMLKNGEEALLTDKTCDALCEAYIRLYQDYSLREKLGRNAFARSKEFSSENMTDRYLKIYAEHKR